MLTLSAALETYLETESAWKHATEKRKAAAEMLREVTGATIEMPALIVSGERLIRVEVRQDCTLVRLDPGAVLVLDEPSVDSRADDEEP